MTSNSITALTGINRVDALLEMRHWGKQLGQPFILSYSIPAGTAYWESGYSSDNEPDTWISLTTTQGMYFRQALAMWQEVTNLGFFEVPDSKGYGEIRIAFSDALAGSSSVGWAYAPGDTATAGDIWLNTENANDDFQVGTTGFSTLLHEIGHAIGLDHPFESSDTNRAILSYLEDSEQYTLMSYTGYKGAGNISDGLGYYVNVQPTTPMLYDILAIQYLYGKNKAVRAGNDVYHFSSTVGELKTIWDAGGIDTFDLSNQSYPMKINLNEGQFSSLGVRQDYGKIAGAAQDNIAIAYGVLIENAVGGKGNDTLIGNAANNWLTGGGGNDTLSAGIGIDTASFQGTKAQYQITQSAGKYQVSDTVLNREGVDSLDAVERLQFADMTVALDIEGNAGQAYRLYQAAFNRQPDSVGLGYWIQQIDSGMSLTKVAATFISSEESQALYGTSPSAGDLINAFYNNVLHRTPDPSGYDFWVAKITHLEQTSAEILQGFSESPENQLQVIGVIQTGIDYSPFL